MENHITVKHYNELLGTSEAKISYYSSFLVTSGGLKNNAHVITARDSHQGYIFVSYSREPHYSWTERYAPIILPTRNENIKMRTKAVDVACGMSLPFWVREDNIWMTA